MTDPQHEQEQPAEPQPAQPPREQPPNVPPQDPTLRPADVQQEPDED